MAKRKRNVVKASEAVPYDDSKWRAQSDMETLSRAEEIKRDKKRMAAAKRCARDKIGELKSVVGSADRYRRLENVQL